jgi:hypothetical protein
LNNQPTIQITLLDYITTRNGRISKKLFEKVVVPKIERLEKKNQIMTNLLKKWYKFEKKSIKKDGAYTGKEINELLNELFDIMENGIK